MDQDFEIEVLQKLARIEANQEKDAENCVNYRDKVDRLEKGLTAVEASAKSAHHRINEMVDSRKDLKQDLTEAIREQKQELTDVFAQQLSGIYKTATLIGCVASFFATIIMWLIK